MKRRDKNGREQLHRIHTKDQVEEGYRMNLLSDVTWRVLCMPNKILPQLEGAKTFCEKLSAHTPKLTRAHVLHKLVRRARCVGYSIR